LRRVLPMLMKRLLVVLLPALAVTMSQSVYAADSAAGRQLAEKWCAKCHNIEKGGPFKLNPPSFASIAAYRTPDVIIGKIIAPSMHSGMPEPMWVLQREDIDNIAAYITSLEAK
jgi:mono/diheme cytochrome c family protein